MQALVLIAMISMLMIGAPATTQTPSKWIKGAPFPEPSDELARVLTGGKVYVSGGFIPPESGPAAWVPFSNAREDDQATGC